MTNYNRVAEAINYLHTNFKQQPDLATVAQQVHLSPQHFQRMFKDWAGVSPKKFMQFLSLDYLRERIYDLPNVQEAADIVGFSAQSRVYDLFVTMEAVTPQEYKTFGQGLTIHYGFHDTPFGECLIAKTERGICALAFVDEESKATELTDFKTKWQRASLIADDKATADIAQQIFNSQSSAKVHLLVKGTNFQVKVWEALLNIPAGAVTTYQHIAQTIDNPKAVRAVGTAIGRNPVALLIPCHRVIRKSGEINQYRWGSTRKKAMIGFEMAGNELH